MFLVNHQIVLSVLSHIAVMVTQRNAPRTCGLSVTSSTVTVGQAYANACDVRIPRELARQDAADRQDGCMVAVPDHGAVRRDAVVGGTVRRRHIFDHGHAVQRDVSDPNLRSKRRRQWIRISGPRQLPVASLSASSRDVRPSSVEHTTITFDMVLGATKSCLAQWLRPGRDFQGFDSRHPHRTNCITIVAVANRLARGRWPPASSQQTAGAPGQTVANLRTQVAAAVARPAGGQSQPSRGRCGGGTSAAEWCKLSPGINVRRLLAA